MPKSLVVIPNWNGADGLRVCLDSLLAQTLPADILVVDNGSDDASLKILAEYPAVAVIRHKHNKGYAGGVNPGFRRALRDSYDYVAPFNNDAVADKHWLECLVAHLEAHPETGAAACKVMGADRKHLDSTGDYYTTWGLPYPRGRDEADHGQYDSQTVIFAASGAASCYRTRMLRQTGLFDEDFFAYYEDVDLSFRAQLLGWQVAYVPESVVYHKLSVTGKRIKGFFTYQTMKNLPMLLTKNVPWRLLPVILPRFWLVYGSFFASAAQRHQLGYALRGCGRFLLLLPKKAWQRRNIQRHRTVDLNYVRYVLHWDLPPNAARWRSLRQKYRRLAGKS